MLHQWFEDLFDMLFYLGIIMGLLIFFCVHWKGEYQLRLAEVVVQDFLGSVSAKGKITLEEYEGLLHRIEKINTDYKVEITCTEYVPYPVYARIPKEELESYYMNRNVRREIELVPYHLTVDEESSDQLCLQTETNATILAGELQGYLPLPEEGREWRVEAVRVNQEVYEGEPLITLCRIDSEDGSYYVEASPVYASKTGSVMLNLTLDTICYQIPVEVICHPRKIACTNGHEIVNSRAVIEEVRLTGNINCPYCSVLPESVTCNVSVLQKQTGSTLQKEEIWLTVQYLDGKTQTVTPEMSEWQDNYDWNYCGIQQVTIQYRGKKDTVTIVTENAPCMECQNSCNERYYTDYIAFPYCTVCMSKVLLFNGTVYEEEKNTNNGELVASLDKQGDFVMDAGSFVTVYISNKGAHEVLLQKETKRNNQ